VHEAGEPVDITGKDMMRMHLKDAFPWLGTDEEVSGADAIEAINILWNRFNA